MGDTIGQVDVELNAKMAKFKSDISGAGEHVSRETKAMARSFREQSHEATASLALISEETGIHIPRHLRSMIATLPGVGTALAAAFNSVAIIALLGIIVEVVKKVQEIRKKAEEADKAWEDLGDTGKSAIRKQKEELIGLEKQLDELQGKHLSALKKQLQLIDLQTFDKLREEFDNLGKKADEAFTKMQVGSFLSFFGLGNDQAVKNAQDDIDKIVKKVHELQDTNDTKGIADAIDKQLADLKSFAGKFENEEHYEVRQQAQAREIEILKQLRAEYVLTNKERNVKVDIANVTEAKRENTELLDAYKKQAEAIKKIHDESKTLLDTELSTTDKKIKAIDQQIKKIDEYNAAWHRDNGGFSIVFNAEREGLVKVRAEIIRNQEAMLQLAIAQEGLKHSAEQLKEIFDHPVKPIYTGPGTVAENEELYKIQRGDVEAIQHARDKIVQDTQTENEKMRQQLVILESIKDKLSPEEYKKAKDSITGLSGAWQKFGTDIGETVKQAALFGRSWTDALKSILIDLVQVILKLTLMKSLGAAGGSSGGGFITSLLGGLFGGGKASGGHVDAGTAYLVGERGPEPFIPDSSGTILPTGSLGGTNYSVHIDARGADAGVEDRLKRLMERNKHEAVALAVASVNDRGRRRAS
jgi:hypothetical protein